MKKILTAFSSSVTPIHVTTFAIQFAKQNSAEIHAVYLLEAKESVNSNYPFPNDLSMAEDLSSAENISKENNKLIDDNIKIFKKECELNGITFSIEKNITAEQLIDETVNSDLLIIDSETDFLEKILTNIHCPAFITSSNDIPQKVVLTCDNSASSKLAIEIYISLLQEYSKLPTYFLSINSRQGDEKEMRIYFKEKLQPHFPELIFQNLSGKVKNELKDFLVQLSAPVLVVMGAFGRSSFSEFFHPSLARTALKEKEVCLFIANNKSEGTV